MDTIVAETAVEVSAASASQLQTSFPAQNRKSHAKRSLDFLTEFQWQAAHSSTHFEMLLNRVMPDIVRVMMTVVRLLEFWQQFMVSPW